MVSIKYVFYLLPYPIEIQNLFEIIIRRSKFILEYYYEIQNWF
ncbi:hypothetical protein BGP_1428 [Beggiatoa sp. PS]|nr:hypothetical protein BGP_1428 [Beggiatoa sp. PS]